MIETMRGNHWAMSTTYTTNPYTDKIESEDANHRYRIVGTAIEVVQENATWLWENIQGEGWSGGFASAIDAAKHWSKTYGVPFEGLRRITDHLEEGK